jgi:hypothetical protein
VSVRVRPDAAAMNSLIAAVRDNNTRGILELVLLIIGVLCIGASAWRAYLRDFPAAVALLVIGIIVLVLAS